MALVIHPISSYSTNIGINLDCHLGSADGTFGLNRTGQVLWDGSYLLSKVLETKYAKEMSSWKAIELGAGICGFPSQVVALYGGNVIATDIEEEIEFLKLNIDRNKHKLKGNITCRVLNWICSEDEIEEIVVSKIGSVDVILCADLCFGDVYKDLARVLSILMQYNPLAMILMSNTDRLQVRKFQRCCYVSNFVFEIVCIDDILSNHSNLATNQIVWKITAK